MTSQPLEWFRFGLFFVICLMVALVAQSIGLVVGALFNVKVSELAYCNSALHLQLIAQIGLMI